MTQRCGKFIWPLLLGLLIAHADVVYELCANFAYLNADLNLTHACWEAWAAVEKRLSSFCSRSFSVRMNHKAKEADCLSQLLITCSGDKFAEHVINNWLITYARMSSVWVLGFVGLRSLGKVYEIPELWPMCPMSQREVAMRECNCKQALQSWWLYEQLTSLCAESCSTACTTAMREKTRALHGKSDCVSWQAVFAVEMYLHQEQRSQGAYLIISDFLVSFLVLVY